MNIRNIKENEFDGTINISSNIKDNKNTVIGKFDIRDLLFILIAGVVGLVVLSVVIAILGVKNLFIVFIALAVLEVPIITLGFLNLYNIPALDYIKMKTKSDNRVYRRQERRVEKEKKDKYLMAFVVRYDISRLEEVINKIQSFIPFKEVEIKIMFNMIYISIDVREDFQIDYSKLFDYLRKNKDIKYVSSEDIRNYGVYIDTLKFAKKKIAKRRVKEINKAKQELSRLKVSEEVNERFNYLTNRIIESKDREYIKIYKILLYEVPIDLSIFNELRRVSNITCHLNVDEKDNIQLLNLNYLNTFIEIVGKEEVRGSTENIEELDNEVKKILDQYKVIYKEIREERVLRSITFLMENSY